MYWAAVAMMDARLDARVDEMGPGGALSTARKTDVADKTGPEEKTKRADRTIVAETTGTECSEALPRVYQRPIDGA
jgi:hypothetical protein